MPKIVIKDKEFNVSDAVSVAIFAERTDANREKKTLKDSVTAKDKEIKTLKDSLGKEQKKLRKIERNNLRDNVLSKISEVDSDYKTKDKNPYKIMADFAKVDKDKRKDKAYVTAFFDKHIDAVVSVHNKKYSKKKHSKKDSKSIIPKKYLGGK